MKNLLTLFSLILIYFSASSQDIGITDPFGNNLINDTIFLDEFVDTTDEFFFVENKEFSIITNNGSNTITIGLRRYEEDVVPGTGDALCWGQTCYGEQLNNPIWIISDTVRIAPGDTAGGLLGGFVTYHYPRKKVGKSTYRYEFYNYNDRNALASNLFVQYRTAVKQIDLSTSGNDDIANKTVEIIRAVDTTSAAQVIELNNFTVKNISPSPLVLGLKRRLVSGVTGVSDSICWAGNCYSQMSQTNFTAPDNITLASGASSTALTINFLPNKLTGNTVYEYEVFNTQDQSVFTKFTLKFNITFPTGILSNGLKKGQFSVFPNPATDLVTFDLNSSIASEKAEIMVVDLLGKVVESVNLNMRRSVDISSYDSGIYFVSLMLDNKLVSSKKLIVSH